MIERIRPKYSDSELAEIYSEPHAHYHWLDHKVRVRSTVALASVFLGDEIKSIADMSCGDGYIPNAVADILAVDRHHVYLGDYADGYRYSGPIEETIKGLPDVDLFILSETLEHLDDPELVLAEISKKSERLILTTPLDEKLENPQHYWRWDKAGVVELLNATGWWAKAYQELTFNYLNNYGYQMWACLNPSKAG